MVIRMSDKELNALEDYEVLELFYSHFPEEVQESKIIKVENQDCFVTGVVFGNYTIRNSVIHFDNLILIGDVYADNKSKLSGSLWMTEGDDFTADGASLHDLELKRLRLKTLYKKAKELGLIKE